MLDTFYRLYRVLFAKPIFQKFNKLLYTCSLRGLGVLNHENDKLSGEECFLKKYLKSLSTGVVIDVGANVGNFSKKVLQINPRLTVYAFEPHPKTFAVLTENIKHQNFISLNMAVGEKDGFLTLFDYELKDGSSHASLYKDVIEKIHRAKSIEHKVQVISLSAFLTDQNIDKISLLKIDTEGNELNVLKGLSQYLTSRKIEAIQFEFNEMNLSSRTYFRDFWEILSHYDLYRLLSSGMIKINDYNPIYCEFFAYQNIVAILKK